MLRLLTITGTTLSVVVLLVLSLANTSTTSVRRPKLVSDPIVVYCAASNRAVMNAVVQDFEEECDVPVSVQYGPSQTLLATAELSGIGDLYLPADESYLVTATEKGLVDDVTSVARMQLVVAVQTGNPLGIFTFQDLLRSDVRLVQANPELAAVGRLTKEHFSSSGHWEELEKHTDAFVSSVTEAANSIQAGAADAAIIYDAVAYTTAGLEPVYIDEFQDEHAYIKVGLIRSSKHSNQAKEFVRYLTSSDRGLRRYAEYGFTPVGGSPWQEVLTP